jgi:hypothetical protein
MKKAAKNSVNGVVKSKANSLAEELILTGSDGGITTDEMVSMSAGKPPKGKFFRVHPTVRADVRILKMKTGAKEERYLVKKSVASKLDYVAPNTAFLCTALDGVTFLWLIGTGDDTWSVSARRIAVEAMERWVRLVPHNNSGTYRMRIAKREEQKPD